MLVSVNNFIDNFIEKFCEIVDVDANNHIIIQEDGEEIDAVTAWISAYISKKRLPPAIVFNHIQPLFTPEIYMKIVAPALFDMHMNSVAGLLTSTFPFASNATYIDIPEKVGDTPVFGIDYIAFNFYTNLKRIDLPSSVKSVGSGAFKDCTNLETIRMPAVEQINEGAFIHCFKLDTIYCDIPKTARKLKRTYRSSVHIICNGVELK